MKTAKLTKVLLGLIFLFAQLANADNSVSQTKSDAARIAMLEKALAPTNPEAVASLFAEANKTRNGAVQFMLFSNSLKEKYKNNWPYWVSGTSSPWITSYTIKKVGQQPNSYQFLITYQWATSSGPFDPPLVQTIGVEAVPEKERSSQKWWIIQFKEK